MQKIHRAYRTQSTIKIDAQLEELDWQKAPVASDFVQSAPDPSAKASQAAKVRLLYDDKAIYLAAELLDSKPDSILKQLSPRDELKITDWFGIIIDAYQDGQNGLGFFVTPSGVQVDMKYSAVNGGGSSALSGDTNWDAVWDSKVRMTTEGWIVELKIPYSALRFPNQKEQRWNINYARMIRRNREELFWNEVDYNGGGLLVQSGQLIGIQDIQSPVRLSATPFISYYIENYNDETQNNWVRSFNGGMDIKYGINDAFTLDMTLIPDFGQTQSDNQVLNLTPFEVRFDENRQFFTEGTELFNKGGLFYSRRVGGRLLYAGEVEDQLLKGEEVVDNPQEAQLYNATKVSGRTKGGLGVGIFNATASETRATIRHQESGDTRSFVTNPLTNYNVMVFDQNLRNNSFVTLINTNVWREGEAYEANTTGTTFSLRNKKNSYAVSGRAVLTQKYYGEGDTDLGHKYNASIEKISGRTQFALGYNVESDTYDPNDLGFLFNNNERNFWGSLRYNRNKPLGPFNSFGGGMYAQYSRLYAPDKFTDFGINFWTFAVTRNFFAFGASTYIEPVATFDYFEPRTDDFSRYYAFPTSTNVNAWISTDYRKRFALDANVAFRGFNEEGRRNVELNLSPRFRFNDKLSLQTEIGIYNLYQNVGYVDDMEDGEIIFGRRDLNTVELILEPSYIFNDRMSLNFRMRHYWSRVSYNSFHQLAEDGQLARSNYEEYRDNSFNALNIDMVYRWRFAPGSDLFAVWKMAIIGSADEQETVEYHYNNSLRRLGQLPQSNSVSVRFIYFLDYLALKKKA